MDFALAPEDERFAEELRGWLDHHLPAFLEREELGDNSSLSGEQSQHRRAAWQRLLNEGRWAAVNWPAAYGGRDATAMQRIIYSEIMAEYRTPGMFNTNGLWQIGPMIIAWGTEEQKERWLPSI
ncbi:MAG: acyl-CoA dehydrogenase family protein, partial [Acidimicrobiales bacterium]